MASRMETRLSYPFPATRVRSALVDPNYLRAKLASVHGDNSEVTEHSVAPDGGVQYTLALPIPLDKLPSIAKTLVPAGERLRRTEVWSSSQDAPTMTSSVVVPNAPARIEATARLEAEGAGSVIVTDLTVSISVPLVGGKIEKALIKQLTEVLEKEHRFDLEWLESDAAGGR
ncbi:DUF2505 domain-containing protein [Pseudonocardiaceae bacterium YIM PH 21723]|nr:DUF2505 domain-containing protein [Pseudonocardiaceae bacterium YIM PH 21723]